jgi:hypothetical protein
MHARFTRRIRGLCAITCFLASTLPCSATILGNVRGVVHDPQHHPISGARATLQATDSDYKLVGETNGDGIFQLSAVPLGEYRVTVDAPGFASATQVLVLGAAGAPILHYQLALAGTHESVEVTA